MVLHWSLSDSKSPQVFKTRLRILAVLNNAVVWIVSTRPPISKSSRPFNNPLVIVPKVPITIGTIVTFMFHSFFNYSVVRRDSKVDNFTNFLFFLLIIMRAGLLAGIRWSVCMLKSHCYFYYYLVFNFNFGSILQRHFTLDLSWGKAVIIYILCYLCFSFSCFFDHLACVLFSWKNESTSL